MGKKRILALNSLAILCLTVLVAAACSNKQVQVSPPISADVAEFEETAVIEPEPDVEIVDAEERRRKTLEKLQAKEKELKARFEALFSQKIYFEYDRSDLSTEAQTILKQMAAALQANPSYSIDIAGHCDERGTIEYNFALGERRARSAKQFLVTLGVSEDRISTTSYGKEKKLDARNIDVAWAKNRRGEFTLK